MRIFYYIIIVFLVNYILIESFPYGGGGTGLGLLITIPVILIATLIVTGIHYSLKRIGKPTKYFQIASMAVLIILSYCLFITEPNNTPFEVIKRMRQTAHEYDTITINDFFLEDRYYNYEKITAAKKKFRDHIFDTAYSVRVNNLYNHENLIETYGIMYAEGTPVSTNKNVEIEQVARDTFRFKELIGKDTIVFYGNADYNSEPTHRTDSFMELGAGHPRDTSIKEATIDKSYRNESPDNNYWAYKVFYWVL